MSDGVQPRRDAVAPADGAGFAGQDEKGRLEDVLRVLFLAQQPPADVEDERTVALDQRGKGGLFAPAGEAHQQVAVTEFGRGAGAGEVMDVAQQVSHFGPGHDAFSRGR